MYEDESMYRRIEEGLVAMGVRVFKPVIVPEAPTA